MEKYLPVLQDATKDIKIPLIEKFNILSMGIGVLLKMMYAFLYQEKMLPTNLNHFFD